MADLASEGAGGSFAVPCQRADQQAWVRTTSRSSASLKKKTSTLQQPSRATERDERRRQKALDKQVSRAERERAKQGNRPSSSVVIPSTSRPAITESVSICNSPDWHRGQ